MGPPCDREPWLARHAGVARRREQISRGLPTSARVSFPPVLVNPTRPVLGPPRSVGLFLRVSADGLPGPRPAGQRREQALQDLHMLSPRWPIVVWGVRAASSGRNHPGVALEGPQEARSARRARVSGPVHASGVHQRPRVERCPAMARGVTLFRCVARNLWAIAPVSACEHADARTGRSFGLWWWCRGAGRTAGGA